MRDRVAKDVGMLGELGEEEELGGRMIERVMLDIVPEGGAGEGVELVDWEEGRVMRR